MPRRPGSKNLNVNPGSQKTMGLPFSRSQRQELAKELRLPVEYAEGEEPYFLVLICGAWGAPLEGRSRT